MRDLKGKIIGVTPGRDAAYARVVKLLRDNGMDAAKDVTFLSVGDGGPAARVAALSTGVIHATMFTPPSDKISEKSGMSILSASMSPMSAAVSTRRLHSCKRTGRKRCDSCAAIWKGFTT